MEWDAVCERYRDAFFGQPANAVTSGAFVLAGVGIVVAARRVTQHDTPVRDQHTAAFGLLVSGIGVGSFIQHGPNPAWQAYAHDLPIAAVLVFTAADALSDLRGRDLSAAWWVVPTMGMVPVVAAGETASTSVQAVMAAGAIGLNLVRARLRPALRTTLHTTLLMVAMGALMGTLTDRTSLCNPDSILQGHAAWHLLAAAALWRLAPAIGTRARLRQLTRAMPRPWA
ncbi:MAG: hypothetical protein ICV70_00760 [Jiangellaceae bacterium]|nr:hypothetical protein [Jiangellaceae bacterium]